MDTYIYIVELTFYHCSGFAEVKLEEWNLIMGNWIKNKKAKGKSIMKDISVIIPVYNTPLDKLEKCIESVLKLKNICDIEVLIIDDGSKDYIKKFFKEKFIGEVVYQYKKNGGVSSARNRGLDIATGKFVCFVDADDIIIEDAFADLEKIEDYQMILFDIEVFENNKKDIWKVLKCNRGMVDKKEILIELLTSNRMNSPCAKLFSNECIQKNKIRFDENMVTGEDMNFVMDFLTCTSKYYYTEEIAYYYQREDSSRMTRIKRYPDIYYDNMKYLNNRQTSIIDKYKMDEYRCHLVEDQVNGAYNYLSDLMMLHLFTDTRRKRVSKDIKELACDTVMLSRKALMKYKLICKKQWFAIRCLAFVRMLYLKVK